MEGGGKVGRLSARASTRMRPAPSIEINTKLVKKAAQELIWFRPIFGYLLISTFQSLGRPSQLLGRSRHSVAVKVADLAKIKVQRSYT